MSLVLAKSSPILPSPILVVPLLALVESSLESLLTSSKSLVVTDISSFARRDSCIRFAGRSIGVFSTVSGPLFLLEGKLCALAVIELRRLAKDGFRLWKVLVGIV